ncbi:MAG TPA: KUP/HAK/KT family potassium transporter, partial [Rhizomicrobium sp.]|nr:KUP/HAK/KT family potassium transporter [Rhizomicrobium sp.]
MASSGNPAADAPLSQNAPAAPGRRAIALTIGALGVVFGDIGTSPLYAMKQSALAAGGGTPGMLAVMGVLSLIFWALLIVVTVKYVLLIMRADNDGEGGVLALAALAHRVSGLSRRVKTAIGLVALLGLALFYGDGMLTPAISVLSAVEGLSAESPSFAQWVMPVSLVILVGLFLIQRHGTQKIGALFGPVMVVWFVVLAVLGVDAILKAPQILSAANPIWAVTLFRHEPRIAFAALGSVVLAVTGCEALYADMGHFGRSPIRNAWIFFALPALLLNYFGQGAALLVDPHAVNFLFYALAPHWAHYPLVALATLATIIASQAVISGVFSISQQAIQLGQLPRMEVRHTSATEQGQIYVPRINAMLCVGVVLIVLIFKSSDALASAYGIAVTGVMAISTFLVAVVALRKWRWRMPTVVAVFGLLGLVDLTFLSANTLKVVEGGWLPLAVAAGVFVVMDTWRVGRRIHLERLREGSLAIPLFLEHVDKSAQRIAGTAVFLTPRTDLTPGPMLHSMKHYRLLHERVILLSVSVEDVPTVDPARRMEVEKLGKGFFAVKLHYGFFEYPDVPRSLAEARGQGLAVDPDTATFFVGREMLVPANRPVL